MKQVPGSRCAIVALMLVFGAFSYAAAQTPSATPDPFVAQITTSPAGGTFNPFISAAGDITANGRFVVIESNGDISTEKTASRNNADGNREIFLFDYAQRRIFQITNTRNTPRASATPTPTPSATPTPSPSPTPADPAQIQIEVSNNRPMITFEPPLVGGPGGTRAFTIVFSSNAPNPGTVDPVVPGGSAAVDGNQEIWIYQVPAVTDVNLSSGADLPLQDLAAGAFTRITLTTPSRALRVDLNPPDAIDDNREATISEDGNIIAFISTRSLVGTGNADGNPELFFFNRGSSTFIQGTSTQDPVAGIGRVFQQNPSISANGSVVTFISTANLTGQNNELTGRGNAEVFVADLGATLGNVRQVTRTRDLAGTTANLLSPGRRMSRDGLLIAFESLTDNPTADVAPTQGSYAIFIYNVATQTFTQPVARALNSGELGFIHFPTFTDYDVLGSPLSPRTLVFASALNFRADGTFPPADQISTGLNPNNQPQVFSRPIATSTFTRLTRNPVGGFGGIRPLTSSSLTRMSFSLGGSELGGGNADGSTEVFYLLTPVGTSEAGGLSFFTGASEIPLPVPQPSPSPSPTPILGTAIGVSAGELTIVRGPANFLGAPIGPTTGSETKRSPALPIELGGVAVSINGAAAGLYFVNGQINFVVPIGVPTGFAPVAIHRPDGTRFRGALLIVFAQPDIFPDTTAPPPPPPANRAVIFNVTNPATRTTEPFTVTSPDSSGATVATVLEVNLTGVRSVVPSEVRITIVAASGNTDITGDAILFVGPNREAPGFDVINFRLPASLAGAGDVKIIVTVTRSSVSFSSRPADTAPLFRIN